MGIIPYINRAAPFPLPDELAWIKRVGNRAADLDLYFAQDLAWDGGPATIPDMLPCSRNADAYYTNADGTLSTVLANVLRYGSRGMLIESQQTNLIVQSQTMDNAAWIKTRSSVTANAVSAPDGTVTADKIVIDSSPTTHKIFSSAVTNSATTTYTATVYVQAGEYNGLAIQILDSGETQFQGQIFNLNTGTIGGAYSTGASITSPAASIQSLANGMYRCTLTATVASSITVVRAALVLANAGSINITGDGTSGCYVWQADLVRGSFQTSPIRTTSLSATRPEDVVSGLPSIDGDFTDVLDLMDVKGPAIILGGGSSTALIERVSSTQIKATDGTSTVTATIGSGDTSRCKVALARQGGTIKLCVNGGTVASGTLLSLDVSSNQYGRRSGGSVVGAMNILRHSRFGMFASDLQMQSLAAAP